MKRNYNHKTQRKGKGTALILLILCLAVSGRAKSATVEAAFRSGRTAYFALLLGQRYLETEAASELEASSRDVAAFACMLGTMPGTPYRITSRLDLAAEEMLEAMQTAFSPAGDDDVCLLYYSGHGKDSTAATRRGILIGADGQAITPEQLLETLDRLPGRKIIILDSCYAGRLITSLLARKKAEPEIRYLILAAAGEGEEAHDGGSGENLYGWFTYSLLHGSGYQEETMETLTDMKADRSGDGAISLEEAWRYAYAMTAGLSAGQHVKVYPQNCDWILWSR